MTHLTKPVHRVTNKRVGKCLLVVTLAPVDDDALIGVRLQGQRTQYVVTLSDVYRWAALTHGNKERIAKANARKQGIPWRTAKKQFVRLNSITQ